MSEVGGVSSSGGVGSGHSPSSGSDGDSDSDSSGIGSCSATGGLDASTAPDNSDGDAGSGAAAQGAQPGASGSLGSQPTSNEQLASEPTTAERLANVCTPADALGSAGPVDPGVVDQSLDVLSTGLVSVPGASAPLNGVAVGNTQVLDSMKFGRFAPNSTIPNRGYSIGTFSQPGSAGYYSMNTMVSSQASWQNARQLDPSLSATRFEVPSPDASVNRNYDRAFNGTYFEDKAGKSINAGQLPKDVALARSGTPVQYTFSGNPVTGNHGPDARVATTLDAANQSTHGRFTSVVSEVEVSPNTVSAVKSASRTGAALRGASRVAAPVAAAIDVYRVGSTAAEHGVLSTETAAVVTETAGGWAGAAAGGYAGAKGGAVVGAMIGGPAGAAVGAVAGGIVGAVGGAIAGSELGKTISGWFGW